MKLGSALHYRYEVDGLRALAVVPVILFHAESTTFSGGFVGVDVFFVISGYLITSILLSNGDNFSIKNFFERRARRLLPALFFVMTISIPAGWYWMVPDLLENFGQSLISTSLFSNNILLWITTDYFGIEGRFKPLLHTWSLSVEEQYYLIFPILYSIYLKFGRSALLHVLILIGCSSLLMSFLLQNRYPTAVFYLLPFRAWELIAGALCAYAPTHQLSRVVSEVGGAIGLSMIIFSVFIFDSATALSTTYLMIPVIGSAFIILCSNKGTFVGKLLSIRPLVLIGTISYSLYLWHQPIISFIWIRKFESPDFVDQMYILILSLLFAYPTWKYIEKPYRNAVSSRNFVWTFVLIGAFLIISGLVLHFSKGHLGYRANAFNSESGGSRSDNSKYSLVPFRYLNSNFIDDKKLNVLVLGNSYARDFINSGLENGYFSNSEISYTDKVPICVESETSLSRSLAERIAETDVLIFGSPTIDLSCWRNDFSVFERLGAKRIVVIGTKNFGWNMNAVHLLDPEVRFQYEAEIMNEYVMLNNAHRAALPPEVFVDMMDAMGGADGTILVYTEERKLISWDQSHLTRAGAQWVGRRLFDHPLLRDLK